jgi:hypothetical protein
MHRIGAEIPIVAVAAAMMAGMVLVVGRAIEPPTEPIVLASRPAELYAGGPATCLAAPLTGRAASGVVGQARLCHDGRDLHLTLRMDGIAPGEVFSAWLGYAHRQAPCQDSSCGSSDLPSDRPASLMQRRIGDASSTARTLELDAALTGVELTPGEQVVLRVLQPGESAGPYAQAIFDVP